MINDCKDITLIDEIEIKQSILHFRFNDDLTLEFNFLDVWTIFFAHADAMAQCEYKELLNNSGYISVHQIQCIADCYKCIDKSLLNDLIYDCYTLNYEGGGRLITNMLCNTQQSQHFFLLAFFFLFDIVQFINKAIKLF